MFSSKDAPNKSKLAIPACIVIGVTGHRKLENESLLVKQVHRVIQKIEHLIPPLKNTPLVFKILSPLAEGADRLVAREVLKIPGAQLEAVLPIDKDSYLKDFSYPESKKEFKEFLARAHRIEQLPSARSRTEAYALSGRYIVDHCDVLVALWNGRLAGGKGGTVKIVHYARERKCPLFWIHTDEKAKISYEAGKGLSPRPFQDLDKYNSERIDMKKVEKKANDHYRLLLGRAKKARLSEPNLTAICEQLLPQYNRMDILALRYQNLYYKAGSLIYALAAAAVAVAAFQALFFTKWSRIILIEVAFMLAVFIIFWLGSRQRWHSKWIDYRFLAERFRSAIFMGAANINVTVLRPPRHLSLSYSSQDWMVDAFSSVWDLLPQSQDVSSSSFEELREFLLVGWIDDQIIYHKNTNRRHWRRHRRLSVAGNILFGCTFVAAGLHVLHLGPHLLHPMLAFMTIVFPAVGAALGGIRIHREYLRNAKRSKEMARHLEEIKQRMKEAEDSMSFLPLVSEAEETMLHENEDWRVVVRFHELEPSA